MTEKWLAVLGLLACLGVWAGMALGPVRRARLARRLHALQATLRGLRARWKTQRQQPTQAQHAKHARQEAADVIARARRRPPADREGNVYRPDAFNGKNDGRDKLH